MYVNFTKIAEKKKKLAYTRNAKFLEKWPKNLLGERYRKSGPTKSCGFSCPISVPNLVRIG